MLLFLLLACGGKEGGDSVGKTPEDSEPVIDSDDDGVPDGEDCDPDDPYTYPGAQEVPYDGIDQDCDGADVMDYDGDGYIGTGGGGDDCVDNNAAVNPGMEEICYNGLDDDCSGDVELPYDCDADGYELSEDCNDEDASIYPGAADAWYDGVDSDCAFDNDYDQDLDGDDWDGASGGDCDDEDPAISSLVDERWNSVDDDCDGGRDNLTTRETVSGWYGTADADDLYLGWAFARLPDLDNDGLPELAIGAPGTSKVEGRTYVVSLAEGDQLPADGYQALISGTAYNQTGAALLHLEEREVLAVAAPASGSGATYLFATSTLVGGASLDLSAALGTLELSAGGLGAWSDLDGNGARELLAWSTTSASVAIFSDGLLTGGTFTTSDARWSATSRDGTTLHATEAGDTDGDGLSELVVIHASADTTALLIPGVDLSGSGRLDDYDGYSGLSGTSTAIGLTDVSGDGHDDLVLSSFSDATEISEGGRIFFIEGGIGAADVTDVATATVTGTTEGGQLHATGVGDLDKDGIPDLVVCAAGSATKVTLVGSCGAVSATSLAAGGEAPFLDVPGFSGSGSSDWFGWSAMPDDVDADGDSDLWISAPNGLGALYLFQNEN